jgi:signal transduction histidine kinase
MGSTILLVDDEKRFRDSSQRLLTGRGYDVMTAENGQRALECLAKNHVDLILLDLKMPVMGGEQFLQAARPLYADIPVVVITGHGTMDTAVNCMKEGVYDFVTKPFDIPQLLLSIERALEKRNLERKAKEYQEETVRNLLGLSTEKKRLETIISCMANGIMVTNKNLEVVLHNPALFRLLGVTDPKNIEEILNNLLTNAVNYSPEGGTVRVTARGVGPFAEIKVTDTGIGIDPQELPKIFDRFYRVKHPKTRQVTGTGLGLSIVKGIVEAYGGSIHVESVPDQGTTFTVLLPAVQGESCTPSP